MKMLWILLLLANDGSFHEIKYFPTEKACQAAEYKVKPHQEQDALCVEVIPPERLEAYYEPWTNHMPVCCPKFGEITTGGSY
ncbi:MAG: hypothetical protein JSW48_09600 [Betaproteobacteria bacterium]|jgi:hypothetical protein|nr:MAG: hypothetical protein JSW48_09600 [Betaproteobacteria bacterium]